MRPRWSGPRAESSPSIPRGDEETGRVLIGPGEKEAMWANASDYEAKMAFAVAEDLRRDLRAALDRIEDLTTRCGLLTEQIVKLKGIAK